MPPSRVRSATGPRNSPTPSRYRSAGRRGTHPGSEAAVVCRATNDRRRRLRSGPRSAWPPTCAEPAGTRSCVWNTANRAHLGNSALSGRCCGAVRRLRRRLAPRPAPSPCRLCHLRNSAPLRCGGVRGTRRRLRRPVPAARAGRHHRDHLHRRDRAVRTVDGPPPALSPGSSATDAEAGGVSRPCRPCATWPLLRAAVRRPRTGGVPHAEGLVGGPQMASDPAERDQTAAAAGRLAVSSGEFVTGTAQNLLVPHGRGGASQYAPERLLEKVVGWPGNRSECLPGSSGGAGAASSRGTSHGR